MASVDASRTATVGRDGTRDGEEERPASGSTDDEASKVDDNGDDDVDD
jgi:hypothetical protein